MGLLIKDKGVIKMLNRLNNTRARKITLVTMIAFLLAPLCALGGSVFMKNGYIIQGTITKLIKNEETKKVEIVVVSYGNGEVQIHSRFIETWILDKTEEARINRKRVLQKNGAAAKGSPSDNVMAVKELELPGFDAFDLKNGISAAPNGGILPNQPGDGVNPGGKPDGMEAFNPFEVVEREYVALGENQELGNGLYGSLPVGWHLEKNEDGAWVMEGPAANDGQVVPRIAGIVFDRKMSRDTQLALAREEVRKVFANFQVLDEGYCELGVKKGFEIFGRGEYQQKPCHVRQLLVWHQNLTWMFNCVWGAEKDSEAQIEASMQSLEFTQ